MPLKGIEMISCSKCLNSNQNSLFHLYFTIRWVLSLAERQSLLIVLFILLMVGTDAREDRVEVQKSATTHINQAVECRAMRRWIEVTKQAC